MPEGRGIPPNLMNKIYAVAKMLLELEDLRQQCRELEETITEAVIELETSVTAGNLMARYDGYKEKTDWEGTVQAYREQNPPGPAFYEAMRLATKTVSREQTAWKQVVEALALSPIVLRDENPTVTIK